MSNSQYIDNKRFELLIQEYAGGGRCNETELMEMFDLLIDNIIRTFKFKIEEEDAKQECFVLILRILGNFDKESGSAFNYFTTVIVNNLRLVYTKTKKYNDKITNYTEHVLQSSSLSS